MYERVDWNGTRERDVMAAEKYRRRVLDAFTGGWRVSLGRREYIFRVYKCTGYRTLITRALIRRMAIQ